MVNIQEIKDNTSMIGVVGVYTNLEQQSSNEYKGVCPFHEDSTPSLFVNEEKQLYKCFGCGASGDLIDFVKAVEKVDFYEALKLIAGKDLRGQTIDFKSTQKKKQNSLLSLVERDKEKNVVSQTMVNKYAENQHQYMLDKGFSLEILKEFKIGFCYDPQDELYNRVTFPWYDKDNTVIAIAGRDITEKMENKYKTKSGGQKTDTLFGIQKLINKKNDYVIVVEDEKSVLRLAEWGYKAVALGNNDIGQRKWLLRQLSGTVILAFDNDTEGVNGRNKAIKELLPIVNVEVIKLYLKDDKDKEKYKDIAEIKEKEIFDKFFEKRDKLN